MASSSFKYFNVESETKGTSKKFKVDVTTFRLTLKQAEFSDADNILTALEEAFDEVFNAVLGQNRSDKIFRIVFDTPALEDPISTLVLPGFNYTAHTFLCLVERVLLSNGEICAHDPLELQIICRDLTVAEKAQRRQQPQQQPQT